MNEINVMSLMKQLNRGSSAVLQNHSTDNINSLVNDIFELITENDPFLLFDYAECGENQAETEDRMLNEIKYGLENDPQGVINYISMYDWIDEKSELIIKRVEELI